MTPEQEKIHQEKIAKQEKVRSNMKQVYIVLGVGIVIFLTGMITFGVLLSSM